MWKLNTSHLRNKKFILGLNDEIAKIKLQTSVLKPIEKCETLKHSIRSYCIFESKRIANDISQKLNSLYQRADFLKAQLDSGNFANNSEEKKELQKTNEEIQEILDYKAKGCLLRCKTQWYGFGQCSSKYFFSLEKSKAKKKRMDALLLQDGSILSDQKLILQKQVEFYSKL